MAKVSVGGSIFASIVIGVIGYVVSYETPSNFKCRISDWRQLKPGNFEPLQSTRSHHRTDAIRFEIHVVVVSRHLTEELHT